MPCGERPARGDSDGDTLRLRWNRLLRRALRLLRRALLLLLPVLMLRLVAGRGKDTMLCVAGPPPPISLRMLRDDVRPRLVVLPLPPPPPPLLLFPLDPGIGRAVAMRETLKCLSLRNFLPAQRLTSPWPS